MAKIETSDAGNTPTTGKGVTYWVCLHDALVAADGQVQQQRRCQGHGKALEASAPPEVFGQVLGADTVETAHPALQAAVVGIDVLDAERVVDNADTGAQNVSL